MNVAIIHGNINLYFFVITMFSMLTYQTLSVTQSAGSRWAKPISFGAVSMCFGFSDVFNYFYEEM
jgi:hypothetical protein